MSDQDKRDGFKDGVREGMGLIDIITRAVRGTDYNDGFEDGRVERERQKSEKDK
jgi:hypothetical protein